MKNKTTKESIKYTIKDLLDTEYTCLYNQITKLKKKRVTFERLEELRSLNDRADDFSDLKYFWSWVKFEDLEELIEKVQKRYEEYVTGLPIPIPRPATEGEK